MRRIVGILLMVLMLGFTASSAVSSGYVVANTLAGGNNTGVYSDFWRILEDEADLIAAVEGGNLSAAHELINVSRLGEKNAANISTQIWAALQGLTASGVKLYYSPEELREMAQNISRNGLPAETVTQLKSQGWSNEQIQALEEYISKNVDNITKGFNMSSFLKNFSVAFLRVGFKYASYEAWGLGRWKWSGSVNFTENLPSNVSINPLLATEWVNLYGAYLGRNTTDLLNAVSSLSARIYNLLTSPSSFGVRSERLRDGRLLLRYESVSGLNLYTGGFAIIKTSSTYNDWKNLKEVTITDTYYWPDALAAYNLTRQVYVIAQAMEMGNDNPELRWILNQKIGELRDALRVHVSESVIETPLKLKSSSPIVIEPPKQPIEIQSGSSGSVLSVSREGGTSAVSTAPESVSPTALQKKALTPTSGEGVLNAKVSVVAVTVNSSYATYRVIVDMSASNNLVTDVSISVHGSGLNDNGHVNSIHPDDGVVSWTSTVSEPIKGSGSVAVAGDVEITYTTTDGSMPTSSLGEDASTGRGIIKEVSLDYSKNIKLIDTVDPSKITFIVQPTAYSINANDSVTFTIAVFNNNDVPVSGSYTLNVVVPEGHGTRGTVMFSKTLNISQGSSTTLTVGPVKYTSAGQFGYYGTFSFGGFQKTASGTIEVRDSSNNYDPGKISVVSITHSPDLPKDGEMMNFTVKVKSTHLTSQNAELELYIDGNAVDSTQGVINANSEETFNLHWLAQQGEHSYTIKAYSIVGGEKFMEDAKSGRVNIPRATWGTSYGNL